jgi:succinyl-CoA synthetase beta subunit
MVASPEEAERVAGEMLGMVLRTHQAPQGVRVARLLVEEPLRIAKEVYAAIVPDRSIRSNVLIVSAMGGMDIETVAEEHPEAIATEVIDPAIGLRAYQVRRACYHCGIEADLTVRIAPFVLDLYSAYMHLDATLVEVNPLAVTEAGALVAADAKVTIDDNALFRQPELAAMQDDAEEDPIEAEARRRGIQYVRLDGSVGVMGNGAGLVMATLDEVARAGGKAANFLDLGGGARANVVRSSLELVLMNPAVRSVLVNIYGGITRCDEVARGILDATSAMTIRVPVIVRLAGTQAAEGMEILRGSGFTVARNMQEAARQAVAAAFDEPTPSG